jgi:hypothetical protein
MGLDRERPWRALQVSRNSLREMGMTLFRRVHRQRGSVEFASEAATHKSCRGERRGREEGKRLMKGYGEARQRLSDQSGSDDRAL